MCNTAGVILCNALPCPSFSDDLPCAVRVSRGVRFAKMVCNVAQDLIRFLSLVILEPVSDPGEIPLKLGFLAPVRVQVFLTILRPAVVESTRIASDGTHRGRTRTPEDSQARLVAFAVLASSARMLEPESCRPNSLLHRQPCRWRANRANSRW